MRRVVAAFLFAVACPACITTNQLPGAEPPSRVIVPPAIDFAWDGWKVNLDPTVVLWGAEAKIDLVSVVRTALSRAERRLKGSPARVAIQAGSYRVIPSIGIGGFTNPATGSIKISLDQRSSLTLEQMLETWLPLVLTHELHHSKRILDGPGYGTTLLEAMVTEGSAEAFVRELYPHRPPVPWVQPLSKSREIQTWNRARLELRSAYGLERHDEWFFGSDGLPRWAGYKIGFAIVDAFMKRSSEVSAAALATMKADEVLEGSRYDP